ncbi:hypothetical protein [Pseudomonas borbori]|uniref:hypothetical protein n=1 Tax=Pseudomonas borbori TaxID=289003 RepID=UPI0011323AFE|nr:hypothetical protein [Pseudomonas borbori]
MFIGNHKKSALRGAFFMRAICHGLRDDSWLEVAIRSEPGLAEGEIQGSCAGAEISRISSRSL